ncbi:MAG: heme-binding protein [Coriobacteriales bacterium]|nr:heme-binding protein [Coriobacteriales bacterium]
MAENGITAAEAAEAMDVLVAQERELRYAARFGAAEALELGVAAAQLAGDYDEAYTVTITREEDGAVAFQWLGEGKGARNLAFAAGKRAAALASGHASPWAQLEAIAGGRPLDEVWARVPEVCPSCGAFPVRAGDEWVATIAVSGLHDGLDHEVIVRALEQVLGKTVPRFAVAVA